MKKLSTYLFLILFSFSAPSFADDIQDFEIEGMSIGDSLLDYFSRDEIENAYNYDDYPSDMKFRIIDITTKDKLYTVMQFYYIPNDKKFIIQSLNGRILYNNINDCYNKKQEIEKILSVTFNNAEKTKQKKTKHIDDPTGKSTYTVTFFSFDKGGRATVTCYDWHKSMNVPKSIGVSIQSQTVSDWVDSDYGVN